MAQVIPIGQPENDAERQVIGLLRDGLSDDYLRDPECKDRDNVVHVEKALQCFRDPSRLP